MALPFRVFDYDRQQVGYVWCMRCKDWIPLHEVWGAGTGCDPHVADHLQTRRTLEQVDRQITKVVVSSSRQAYDAR
jgi:hypothetical protein